MCGRTISVEMSQLEPELRARIRTESLPSDQSGNADVAPTDHALVITHQRPKEIQYMRWGLIPAHTTDPKSIPLLFNARAETILEKASFRGLLMQRRCLAMNTGYYEWSKEGDDKVQWSITPAAEKYFYMAGLWTTWRDVQKDNKEVNSFTIITCEPDSRMAEVHNRMPVILSKADRRLWMTQNAAQHELLALFKPCEKDLYQIYEHSRVTKAQKKAKGEKTKFENTLF